MPGKWWISSNDPVDESFTRTGRRTFVRRLAHDDVLDCYDLSRPGTYRGMPVEVSSSEPGGYVVTARDPKAAAEGFKRADHRSPPAKVIAFDDPQLRFTTEVSAGHGRRSGRRRVPAAQVRLGPT
ncbi:hypothetical protein [Lentzea sp. NEAU-D7]|uniref:hypothetical protein n=1 Tax=Lentzea sp. NEAU-D7 TaxID=2994667 RepID=UPI00224B48C9|nr:hypothetical protein [Lentzea sp. NEAU-D7]MCX2953685.1 hypothetical protein [Lentzea sp. NEAU-D7]